MENMTRRERLMSTLRGGVVDRLAVNFYEVGGFLVNPNDPDEYNIYNSPSWQPLINLAENHTDIIRMLSPVRAHSHLSWSGSETVALKSQFVVKEIWEENNSRFTRTKYKIEGKELTGLTRRDKDIDTIWAIEHLLKNSDDVKLFLKLPDEIFEEEIDVGYLKEQEDKLGNRGIVMVDSEDPVCAVASLFSLENFTIFALTEQDLCHKLLEKHARYIHKRTEKVAREFPGRLWRIYGPEYVTEPFLPPYLFNEYVFKYTGPMVTAIKKYGGFARLHAHGRIKNILKYIVNMDADAIDPVEPPPQGDIELQYLKKNYGKQLVLFGNIEITDIENMPNERFRKLVKKTIVDGTAAEGRGFVLMPSASPYGRTISELTLLNYHTMVEEIKGI